MKNTNEKMKVSHAGKLYSLKFLFSLYLFPNTKRHKNDNKGPHEFPVSIVN